MYYIFAALMLGLVSTTVEYLWPRMNYIVPALIVIGLVYLSVKRKQKIELEKLKKNIKVFKTGNIGREYQVIKTLSVKGKPYRAEYSFFKEAQELNADAIINFNSNTNIVSDTYSSKPIPFESASIQTSHTEILQLSGDAVKFKYTEEEEKIIYKEEQAVEDIKKLNILKENSMIDDDEYEKRKKEIQDRFQQYKDFLQKKENSPAVVL